MVNKKFVFVVFIFALAGIILPISDTTVSETVNFQIVKNHTNLNATGQRSLELVYDNTGNTTKILSVSMYSTNPIAGWLWLEIDGIAVGTITEFHNESGERDYFSLYYLIPPGTNYSIKELPQGYVTVEYWYEWDIISTNASNVSFITNVYQNGAGGTNFTLNVSGNNPLPNYSILRNGTNVTLLQYDNNHTIIIDSVAGTTVDLTSYVQYETNSNFYVSLSGSNSNDCLTVSTPCRTITHIFSIIKPVFLTDVYINVMNGSLDERITVPFYFTGSYKLTLRGYLKTNQSGIASSGGRQTVFGTSGYHGWVRYIGAGWTTDAYKHKLLENNVGQYVPIISNNATYLQFAKNNFYFDELTSGESFRILDWNSTLYNNSGNVITYSPNAKMNIENLNIESSTYNCIYGDGVIYGEIYRSMLNCNGGIFGAVYLLSQSKIMSFDSVYKGSLVIRLESNSNWFDRAASSIYYMNISGGYNSAFLVTQTSMLTFIDGAVVDGINKPVGSRGFWVMDVGQGSIYHTFIENFDNGIVAQYNGFVRTSGLSTFINVNTNYNPNTNRDNSSIIQ